MKKLKKFTIKSILFVILFFSISNTEIIAQDFGEILDDIAENGLGDYNEGDCFGCGDEDEDSYFTVSGYNSMIDSDGSLYIDWDNDGFDYTDKISESSPLYNSVIDESEEDEELEEWDNNWLDDCDDSNPDYLGDCECFNYNCDEDDYNDSIQYDEDGYEIIEEILNDPIFITNIINIGSVIEQSNNSKVHIPSSTDVYSNKNVENNITKTFRPQEVNNCMTHALGFVGDWIKENGVSQSEVFKKIIASPDLGPKTINYFFGDGPPVTVAANIVRVVYDYKLIKEKKRKNLPKETAEESLKRTIDQKDIVFSYILVKSVVKDPNDPTKTITKENGHAVVILGYTDQNEFIYYDPNKGRFMTAPESEFDKIFRISLKNSK